jgi:hypothetical protein
MQTWFVDCWSQPGCFDMQVKDLAASLMEFEAMLAELWVLFGCFDRQLHDVDSRLFE